MPAKEPEIPRGVRPAGGRVSRARNVCGAGGSHGGGVDPFCAGHVSPVDPGPFAAAVLPQVVNISVISSRVVAIPAKQPEIPTGIAPTRTPVSRPGNVGGAGGPHGGGVDSRLVVHVWAVLPGPFVNVRA